MMTVVSHDLKGLFIDDMPARDRSLDSTEYKSRAYRK